VISPSGEKSPACVVKQRFKRQAGREIPPHSHCITAFADGPAVRVAVGLALPPGEAAVTARPLAPVIPGCLHDTDECHGDSGPVEFPQGLNGALALVSSWRRAAASVSGQGHAGWAAHVISALRYCGPYSAASAEVWKAQ